MRLVILLALAVASVQGGLTHPKRVGTAKKPVQVEKPGVGGMFGFQPPQLNKEEDLGVKLPRRMHCDGDRGFRPNDQW